MNRHQVFTMKIAESANGKFTYYTGFCTHCIVIINITGLAIAMKIQITVSYKDLNPQTGAPFRFIEAHQCGYRDLKCVVDELSVG